MNINSTELPYSPNLSMVEDALDSLHHIKIGLESVKDTLVYSLESGGITKQSAIYADIAIKNISRDWLPNKSIIPSLEDYDTDPVKATEYSLETVMEKLKDWWEAIKRLITKWITEAVVFWQKITEFANRIKKKAEGIVVKARRANNTVVKELSISNSNYHALYFGHDVNTDSILRGLQHITNIIYKINVDSVSVKCLDNVLEALRTFDPTTLAYAPGAMPRAIEFISKHASLANVQSAITGFENIAKHNGIQFYVANNDFNRGYSLVSEPFIGGKVVSVVFHTVTVDEKPFFAGLSIGFVNAPKETPPEESSYKIKGLTNEEVILVADEVIKNMDIINKTQNEITTRKKIIEEFTQYADRVSRLANDMITTATLVGMKNDPRIKGWYYIRAIIENLHKTTIAILEPDTYLRRQTLASANAALQVCLDSLGTVGTTPPEDDTDTTSNQKDKEQKKIGQDKAPA